MIQQEFALRAKQILEKEPGTIGLAVGGSWLSDEIDEFSDLDLILVTRDKVSHDMEKMLDYARKLGTLLNGFTGEHVGEPRLLICLYDAPLLHVDIKFLTTEELNHRVETPHILLDKEEKLKEAFEGSTAHFPYPDYQWIEDRFWTWVHYATVKIGRGEYMEANDFFAFMRMTIFGPLLHIKSGNLPRGVRKAETELHPADFESLKSTIPEYSRESLLNTLRHTINLYQSLRASLFSGDIVLRKNTEEKVLTYLSSMVGTN